MSEAQRVRIESSDGKAASACPTVGTFIHAHFDLNGGSRDDAILRDFSGGYGLHEVVHFMLFAQCADGTYLPVGADMLSGVI